MGPHRRAGALAWVSAIGVASIAWSPAGAETHVTIPDLKDAPELYYGQQLRLECYYDKESPIWVRALPQSEDWIGFFVTGAPDKALTVRGEYYNLLFAPYSMRDALRSLRGGDKITVIGEGFRYHSLSLDGVGIRVAEIRHGWGPSAEMVGQGTLSTAAAPQAAEPLRAVPATDKYAVTINGKRYEGLRFHDRYNFDGVEFQVEEEE